jgi:hypothetical protein
MSGPGRADVDAARGERAHRRAPARTVTAPDDAVERAASDRAAHALSGATCTACAIGLPCRSASCADARAAPEPAARTWVPTTGGAPLPPTVRREFAPRFAADLDAVRVHDHAAAHEAAAALTARAFTVGHDVVFAAGQFAPTTAAGRALLAHELAHVEQGGGGPIRRQVAPVAVAADASTPAISNDDQMSRASAADETSGPSLEDAWFAAIGPSEPYWVTAHVCVPLGLRVRTQADPTGSDLGVIPFDTRVQIIRRTSDGWCYVRVLAQDVGAGTAELAGEQGFVEARFLMIDPPDRSSFLHYVSAGEDAGDIVASYYERGGRFKTGADARLYAWALWIANQDLRTAAGGYPGRVEKHEVSLPWYERWPRYGNEEEAVRVYKGISVKADHAIWVPSLRYVRELRLSGEISSGAILSEAGEAGGFTRGLFGGIYEAVKDAVEDAIALVELIVDVVQGDADKLAAIAAKVSAFITNFDRERLGAAANQALRDFIAEWTDPDPFLRGHFQGTVVGYLLVLALPMVLSGGAAVVTVAPRASRILRVLGLILDPLEAIGDAAAVMRGSKQAERLFASNLFRERKGLLSEPFEGGLKGVEDAFDLHLDDAFPDDAPWGGFTHDRHAGTRFDHETRRINFQMQRNMNKFSVAEEVQHALDYTQGAVDPLDILNTGRRAGVPDDEIVDWWHRRVFTRMMKNIAEERFGLGFLKGRLDEVHQLYREIGGKLTLKQILASEWEGLY